MTRFKNRQEILDAIKESEDKIRDLQKRGDAACSKYDLMMGYDADFYLNRVPLPRNHLIYYRRELAEWDSKHKTPNVQLTLPL